MTIEYFGAHQNDVFVPALLAALVATVLVALPVVFAPGLRRDRRGRALTAVSIAVAAAALVVAGWQAGDGIRALEEERSAVRAELLSGYGLDLDGSGVRTLIDGDALPRKGEPALRLRSTGGDGYEVLSGRTPLPRQA